MKKESLLPNFSDFKIPMAVYVALLFVILIILFFAFRFLTDNFVLVAILGIFLSGIALFGFFFFKVYKGSSERKAYAILILFVIPLGLNFIPGVDAAVIPLDEVNSSRTDTQEIINEITKLRDELSVIKADVGLIKQQLTVDQAETAVRDEPDLILFVFPILIIQFISTAIIILFFRNR